MRLMIKMKKELIQKLQIKANELGEWLSKPKENYPHYHFRISEMIPLSEYTAVVIYDKLETGKKALAFFYWTEYSSSWSSFFPKESHVYGFEKVRTYLQETEEHNFNIGRLNK